MSACPYPCLSRFINSLAFLTSTYHVVVFDDGNIETSLDEIWVMKKEDYEVLSAKPGESSWIGVKKCIDRSSNDEYAKTVGWYEMCCDGEHQIYTSLCHALRSHDKVGI